MSSPHWCLILNGKCAGDNDLREAVAGARRAGTQLQVRVTWEAGDERRYVDEQIAAGVACLVAAGGDGTLSAVASAMAERPEAAADLPALALVPMGTANDFATAASIPMESAQALQMAAAVPAVAADLLRIECNDQVRWCANLASGGFGTKVTVETNEGMKKMLGGLAYLITGISRMGKIEPIRVRLAGPGFEWQGSLIALGVGNGRQAGGGQVLCPDALIDDGLLDLTVVPELAGEVGATVGALLTEGKEAALDRVAVRRQLPWLQIDCPGSMTLNLDGEPLESTRFRITCVPGRLRMHLPPDCALLG